MFAFLRTIFPPRVKRETVKLLVACFEQMHDARFNSCIEQLKAGLLQFYGWNNLLEPNYVNFTYFTKVSSRFKDDKGRWARISGIQVRNGSDVDYLSIYISYGLVSGYAFEIDRGFVPDMKSIDTSKASIAFLDTPISELENIIPVDAKPLVNWTNVYEVEFKGVTYYHVQDIGDGDFIGVDHVGKTYEIHHDPFEIISRKESLRDVLLEIGNL